MHFLSVFQILLFHSISLDAAKCPRPGKRRWLTDLNDVFTSLLDESTNGNVTPRSTCLPVFKPAACTTVSRNKQVCISEIRYRNGYQGHFQLADVEDQKCYVKVHLRRVKPKYSFQFSFLIMDHFIKLQEQVIQIVYI